MWVPLNNENNKPMAMTVEAEKGKHENECMCKDKTCLVCETLFPRQGPQ